MQGDLEWWWYDGSFSYVNLHLYSVKGGDRSFALTKTLKLSWKKLGTNMPLGAILAILI